MFYVIELTHPSGAESMAKRAREAGTAQDAADFAIVRHWFQPSYGAPNLLRSRRVRRLSSDPASAEFSHRTR
jgi:hypothetical protein